jgi:hypothetical protein
MFPRMASRWLWESPPPTAGLWPPHSHWKTSSLFYRSRCSSVYTENHSGWDHHTSNEINLFPLPIYLHECLRKYSVQIRVWSVSPVCESLLYPPCITTYQIKWTKSVLFYQSSNNESPRYTPNKCVPVDTTPEKLSSIELRSPPNKLKTKALLVLSPVIYK